MSGQFMYIQTVQSDTGTLNFYSFLNFIIIHQQLKQRTSIRIKNYFTDHIYSPQWQISGAGELEWLVWQSGVTGDWKKKKLTSSHRKNIVQIHVNTHIQVDFCFAWQSRGQSYCVCGGVVLGGAVRGGPSTRSTTKNLHVVSWEPSYLLFLTTSLNTRTVHITARQNLIINFNPLIIKPLTPIFWYWGLGQ